MQLTKVWTQFGRLAAVAALVVGSAGAFADPLVPDDLNPGLGDAGVFSLQVCPTPAACPTDGGSIMGDVDIFFNIVGVDGIANVVAIGGQTPFISGAFTFTWTVYDPGNNVLSTGGPPQVPADFGVVVADNYKVALHWVFTAAGGATPQSAGFILNVTTGVVNQTPEPGTLLLIGIALAGMGIARRKLS